MKPEKFRWQKSHFNSVRDEIRKELASVEKSKQLNHIMGRISALSETTSSLDYLKQYVYILYALLVLEGKGLQTKKVDRLTELAKGILMANGIRPQSSRLSFLYRDLHLIRSRIFRNQGDHWFSAWEQNLAYHCLRRQKGDSDGTEFVSQALRASRLGETETALDLLKKAESSEISPQNALRSRIEKVRLLRLSGQAQSVSTVIKKAILESGNDGRLDLKWEQMCCEVKTTGDIHPLIFSVQKGKTHYDPSYALDAFLWSRAAADRKYIERFPTVRTLSRGWKSEFKSFGVRYEISELLGRCYDSHIPFTLRLQSAEKITKLAKELPSLEQELLTWCALSRWLFRFNNTALAGLALGEYRALSLRLSRGKFMDALGIAGDLLGTNNLQGVPPSESAGNQG